MYYCFPSKLLGLSQYPKDVRIITGLGWDCSVKRGCRLSCKTLCCPISFFLKLLFKRVHAVEKVICDTPYSAVMRKPINIFCCLHRVSLQLLAMCATRREGSTWTESYHDKHWRLSLPPSYLSVPFSLQPPHINFVCRSFSWKRCSLRCKSTSCFLSTNITTPFYRLVTLLLRPSSPPSSLFAEPSPLNNRSCLNKVYGWCQKEQIKLKSNPFSKVSSHKLINLFFYWTQSVWGFLTPSKQRR